MTDIMPEIEAFLEQFEMSEHRFGKLSMRGDMHLIQNIRDGRKLGRDTVRRIRRFMKNYEPPTSHSALNGKRGRPPGSMIAANDPGADDTAQIAALHLSYSLGSAALEKALFRYAVRNFSHLGLGWPRFTARAAAFGFYDRFRELGMKL